MDESENFWEKLLGGNEATAQTIEMRLVRKRGRPFLLLPMNARLATQTLALYPAQTFRARVAKSVLRTALKMGIPLGSKTVSVRVSSANPLLKFLAERATGAPMLQFGILAGNPNAAGRRFILLVFDASGKPAAVVKAGSSAPARELIRKEKNFLDAASQTAAIPRLRASFESAETEAIALDFIQGRSPEKGDESEIPRVLASWIDSSEKILISQTRVWAELQQSCGTIPLFTELAKELGNKHISPVIFHGDFAPWNIKVAADGKWTVFDWERGDLRGLPGYDWFHYLIQTRLLVAREPVAVLI
jgi:hypothetical protein